MTTMPGSALKLMVLLSALLLVSFFCPAQSNVYSLGIYSAGKTSSDICRLTMSFAPRKYYLTQLSWREDARGSYIIDIRRKSEPDDVSRRFLEVECGEEKFTMPLDFLPASRHGLKDTVVVVKGTNDVVDLVMQCLTNRGGQVSTNKLSAMPMNWMRHSRDSLDVIIGSQDRFDEWQKLLEQAYGSPNPKHRSDGLVVPDVPIGNGRLVIYTPQQLGVMLVLSSIWKETIISIIGRAKK